MRWYEGGIADAVATSKKNGAIFVVFVEGKDKKSQEITKLIDDSEVSERLQSDSFVAIKIEANSVPHQQFSQIYKQASVPSVFFIGKTGTPLEIVTEPTNLKEFSDKIDNILVQNGYKTTKTNESSNFIKEEQQSSSNTNVVCENGVCKLVRDEPSSSKEPETPEPSSQEDVSVEDKVEKAKKLVEKIRETKEAEEKEKERLKEIERRKMGQDVQKMKRWQEDEDMKHILEEREKEKREQKAARDRILQQIAQDKADRAARFSNSPPVETQPSPQPVRRPAASANSARLQFRLPDGSSHTQDFPSKETLQTVRNYVTANINLPFKNYVLSTAFPRREFTAEDNVRSLVDLELVPNAVILILPSAQGVVNTQGGGGFGGLFWFILSPFLNIFGYLKTFIFGSGTQRPESDRGAVKRSADVPETSRVPPKRRMGESTVIRQEGNVHRLSDKTDDDDENNTWNGNSTQQM